LLQIQSKTPRLYYITNRESFRIYDIAGLILNTNVKVGGRQAGVKGMKKTL
jgi:hypothetical protein